MATPTYDLIETTTLTSSASSVTFSSITQDYRDLVLVVTGTASGLTDIRGNFNGDTASNYNLVDARGDGSNTSSISLSNFGQIIFGRLDTTQSMFIFQTLDYSATDKHKTSLSRQNATNDKVIMAAHRYASTNAITSIFLQPVAQTFDSGTTLSLYGIAS